MTAVVTVGAVATTVVGVDGAGAVDVVTGTDEVVAGTDDVDAGVEAVVVGRSEPEVELDEATMPVDVEVEAAVGTAATTSVEGAPGRPAITAPAIRPTARTTR